MRFLLAFAQGGVLSPLLPLLRETFHVGYGELGLLISMFGLSRVAMDIMAAYLLSWIPLFRLLLLGIMITGLGSLLLRLGAWFLLVGQRPCTGRAWHQHYDVGWAHSHHRIDPADRPGARQ